MYRCRICDVEFPYKLGILDDELCMECEEVVLETISEWEVEDTDVSSEETEGVS